MAALVGRATKDVLLKAQNSLSGQQVYYSEKRFVSNIIRHMFSDRNSKYYV